MTVALPPIQPMLASSLRKGEDASTFVGTHAFDLKLDGLRCLAYHSGSGITLRNRSGRDITEQFPELARALFAIGSPFVLDGEIVALSGIFTDVATRAKQVQSMAIAKAVQDLPCAFVAFDLLVTTDMLDPTRALDIRYEPWNDRRALLEARLEPHISDTIQISPVGYDLAFVENVKSLGMEGVIAKRLTSTYRTGRFSDWVKIKNTRTLTAVAIGYEPGTGARAHFGAMFLALIGPDGPVEIGRVGSGFTASEITHLKGELDAGRPVVVEIEALNRTKNNQLRFPVYLGVRTDLSVHDARLSQLEGLPLC